MLFISLCLRKSNKGDILIDKVNGLKNKNAEELVRMGQLDNKSAKLLVVLTVILVALGMAMLLKSQSVFSPSLPIEWIRLVALLLATFSFVCSWGHTLLALKIESIPSENKDGRSSFISEKQVGTKRRLIAENMEELEKLSEAISEKKRNIRLAYEELTMGAWFIGITVAISIGMKLLG